MKEYKESFLGQVVIDLIKHCGNGNQEEGFEHLHEWTLVFPTHRAGLFVKEMLRKQMREAGYSKPICSPDVTTHSDLFNRMSSLYAEDEIRMVCTLYHIFKEKTGNNMPLDLFYNWGRQLINDFSNVDKAYPIVDDPEKFWDHSAAASKLENLTIDEELKERLLELINKDAKVADGESKRQQFETLWENLPAIYTQFNEELASENKGYEGARLKNALLNPEQAIKKLNGKKYAFIGFNYLQPAEKALMKLIQENTETLFYFDYEPDFSTNKVAFKRCADNAKELKSHFENKRLLTNKKAINVIATSSSNAQAQYVHQWLQENHKQGDSTAIVICDENMLEPVVFALPKEERVNITKGFPLRSTKAYATISSFFNKEAKEKDENGKDIYDVKTVFNGLLERLKQEEQAERRNDWKGLLVTESVYQVGKIVRRFQALMEDGTLADITTVNALRNLMLHHLESINIPFNGEPLTDIQVIGVLETRTLDFDNLLLLNVEEGIVPQQKSHNSFIPYYISKLYGLQTYNESAEIYAYNFFRLLRRAKNVTMMFSNGESGGMNQKSMSRFLMQMLADATNFAITRFNLIDSAETDSVSLKVEKELATTKLSQLTLCQKSDEPKDAKKGYYYPTSLLNRIKEQKDDEKKTELKPFSLSPSAIRTYLTCPRSYFLQNVMNISETNSDTLFFERNDIGTLIHNTIQILYEGIGKQKTNGSEDIYPFSIEPHDIEVILEGHTAEENGDNVKDGVLSIRESLKEAYSKLSEKKGVTLKPHEHETENSVIEESVCNILRADLEQSKSGLEILMQEKKVYSEMDIEGGKILIGGDIDRLDYITEPDAEGNPQRILRVVDYKTGHYKAEKMAVADLDKLFEDKNGEQGYLLQTLIYSLACINTLKDIEECVKPTLFFTEKQLTTFDSSLKIGDTPITDVKAYKEELESRLRAKAIQILTDKNYEQLEDGKCSKYCPFLQLCGKEPKPF